MAARGGGGGGGRLVWLIGWCWMSTSAWSFQLRQQMLHLPIGGGNKNGRRRQHVEQQWWSCSSDRRGVLFHHGLLPKRRSGRSASTSRGVLSTNGSSLSSVTSSAAAGLIDVALDVPLPIYFTSTATSTARTRSTAMLLAPVSRLLIVIVVAISVGLLRRTVLPRLVQTVTRWYEAIKERIVKDLSTNTPVVIESPTIIRSVIPPLETYTPTTSSTSSPNVRRQVGSSTAVAKPGATSSLLQRDDEDKDDGEDEADHDDDIDLSDKVDGEDDDEQAQTIDLEESSNNNDDATISTISTAMRFDDEGWGQARLVAKEQLVDSTLIKLSFALPRTSDYLPLAVGDKVRLCCMVGGGQQKEKDDTDNDDDDTDDDIDNDTPLIAEVYPFGDASSGQFSFLVEDPSLMNGNVVDDEDDEEQAATAQFVRTILDEYQPGDTLAIQPAVAQDDTAVAVDMIAPWQLAQNNIHTIMYWANGSGISPALDHVRIILDDDDDDDETEKNRVVQNASLLWVNNAVADFTYAENDLEEQYERHGDRLAIACIAEETPSASDDIANALVPYAPGVLAVLSGPRSYTADAAQFLMDSKGYPAAAICIL